MLQVVVDVGFLLFLVIYFVVLNRRMDWGKVWIGTALAGVLFEALALLSPLYVRLTGGGSTYGKTFGLLFLLTIYFYLLGIVTMVGVEGELPRLRVLVDQPQGKEDAG